MATIRRAGFGTVFELEDSKVGIGTDAATHTLQALGNIRSEAATDIGISTLTTYQGFVDKEARFTTGQIDNQSQSGSTSGEIVIDGDVTVSSATTFTSGPQHLTVTDTFTLPSGDTNSRELKPTPGSLRFNQDFASLEFYTGNNWATVNAFSRGNAAGRQVLMGGHDDSARTKLIEFFLASTGGTTTNFGELFFDVWTAQGSSNHIRGIHGGGNSPSPGKTNTISYITIASEGDAIDFGDFSQQSTGGITVTSSTRAVCALGGQGGTYINNIEYVEIMTLGNALDFGDLTFVRSGNGGGCSNGIRGLFMGGYTSPSLVGTADISSITIASKGNATKFGDLIVEAYARAGFSNSVRGICVGGRGRGSQDFSTIEYVTIASDGNATNFGDISYGRRFLGGSATQTRGFIMPGYASDANFNRIEAITIASTGNSVDFGDSTNRRYVRVASDSHGGLGGF